jgi:predicted transcriptional regulator
VIVLARTAGSGALQLGGAAGALYCAGQRLPGGVAARPARPLVESALEKELDYQEWFLKRVDEGFADLKEGRRLSWEEFEELRHRHRASRAKKRAKGA